MTRCRLLFCTLLAGACIGSNSPAAIYEVPEAVGEVVGAWDMNILADDIHFETAAILSMVRIRLAIAGVQTCKLWIFDAMDSPPIHTVLFTNRPATTPYDVSTYSFPMQLQVPKDIYVGFSAQVGGWTVNGVDYWSRGMVVNRGVAGTPGQYYYGPVTGETLNAVFTPADNSFGCIQILAEPVLIEDLAVVTGHVHLAIASLPIHATNTVESSGVAGGTNWLEQAILPLGVSSHVWSATNTAASNLFYRVKSR